jgi:hypothetical protein
VNRDLGRLAGELTRLAGEAQALVARKSEISDAQQIAVPSRAGIEAAARQVEELLTEEGVA